MDLPTATVASADATPGSPWLLEVQDLHVHFVTTRGVVRAVEGISYTVRPGEVVALVGESGCGKSVSSLAIMRLLAKPAGRIVGGRILFEGRDLLQLSDDEMRELRGRDIAMIFQEPMTSLNPVLTIGFQIMEPLLIHLSMDMTTARKRATELLRLVGIPDAERRLDQYPHQFSGGMRQRVAIAIALLHRPSLIIADEPTTALDVTVQGQILYEMQRLVRDAGSALMWITHDLAVIAGLADRIAVMYAGRIVEEGPVADVLDAPLHPYTRGLIDSVPANNPVGWRLHQIPGMTPSLLNLDTGCAFRSRCTRAVPACKAMPELALAAGRRVRCVRPLAPESA